MSIAHRNSHWPSSWRPKSESAVRPATPRHFSLLSSRLSTLAGLFFRPMRLFAQLPFVFAVAWGCRAGGLYAPPRPVPRPVARLRASIDSMVGQPEFSNANWGILIVDPTSGDTLYSRNAGKLFMPASNMKILTTSTALTQLGPTFQYHTVFAARGAVADSTLG